MKTNKTRGEGGGPSSTSGHPVGNWQLSQRARRIVADPRSVGGGEATFDTSLIDGSLTGGVPFLCWPLWLLFRSGRQVVAPGATFNKWPVTLGPLEEKKWWSWKNAGYCRQKRFPDNDNNMKYWLPLIDFAPWRSFDIFLSQVSPRSSISNSWTNKRTRIQLARLIRQRASLVNEGNVLRRQRVRRKRGKKTR